MQCYATQVLYQKIPGFRFRQLSQNPGFRVLETWGRHASLIILHATSLGVIWLSIKKVRVPLLADPDNELKSL